MSNTQDEAKTNIRNLVSTGIEYEDEFVEKYFKILQDNAFMNYFGENGDEAKRLFNSMIEESKAHKKDLQKIYESLS